MGFKGFSGKDGSKKGGRPALRPWRGGEGDELRFYINHPECKAKIWFVRDDDGDWILKKWDNAPDEYPDFAHSDTDLAPHESVAVKVLDACYGPLNMDRLNDQIENVLNSEEKAYKASEDLSVEDDDAAAGDLGDDPLPDF